MYCAFERHLQLQRIFHRTHAGHGVHGGADAAEALREQPCFARIAPVQNLLDAAPHRAGRPCVADRVVVHFDVDAEMAFDSGDGIDRDSFCHDVCRSIRILLLRRLVVAEISELEITGPADVRPAEPEVARHVVPLVQRSRQNRQPLHCDQESHNSQSDKAE